MPTVIPNDQSGNGSTSRYGSVLERHIPESRLGAGDADAGADFLMDNTARIARQ